MEAVLCDEALHNSCTLHQTYVRSDKGCEMGGACSMHRTGEIVIQNLENPKQREYLEDFKIG
jgi:hypothetical protein